MCVYIPKKKKKRKKDNKTVAGSETTDMFLWVLDKTIRTKLCRKIIQEKKRMVNTFLRVISLKWKDKNENLTQSDLDVIRIDRHVWWTRQGVFEERKREEKLTSKI